MKLDKQKEEKKVTDNIPLQKGPGPSKSNEQKSTN